MVKGTLRVFLQNFESIACLLSFLSEISAVEDSILEANSMLSLSIVKVLK